MTYTCQHCYRDVVEEYICSHCKLLGHPDYVCEACYETIHEYHEDDGFVANCDACYWEVNR